MRCTGHHSVGAARAPAYYACLARHPAETSTEALPETELGRQRDYWAEALRGALPLLQLPPDRPRAAAQPEAARAVLRRSLGRELLQAAGGVAHALAVQLQAVLLAVVQVGGPARSQGRVAELALPAYKSCTMQSASGGILTTATHLQAVLLRLSGQDEVTVGVPGLGSCATPLPVRVAPPQGASFAAFARLVASALEGAAEHSGLPFHEVAAAAGAPHVPGTDPLFQASGRLVGEAYRYLGCDAGSAACC